MTLKFHLFYILKSFTYLPDYFLSKKYIYYKKNSEKYFDQLFE